MSITTELLKSVSDPRVLVQLDIGQFNTQWINHGAGIWAVNPNNIYDWVDSTLLTGFTAQLFGNIGSVTVDGLPLQQTSSLAAITNLPSSFYYDGTLYVCLVDYDEPLLHQISIGIIYGFSHKDFSLDDGQFYDGRLDRVPNISTRRDPLFWGKLAFDTSSIDIINADGEYDMFGEDNYIYGNEVRIYFGYAGLDFADYIRLYTGYIDRLSVGEDRLSISVADKRKQLTKPITYSCTEKNALEAIEEILLDNYTIPYNSVFYNTTDWETAKALASTITIDMQEPEGTIEIIQGICASVFGVFLVESDGRFSFKIVDESTPASVEIEEYDILNKHVIEYDPSEVISSIRVGYDRDWTTTSSPYTFLEDTSREAEIYQKYKTYNQREFLTFLGTLANAEAFASAIYDYAENVRGNFSISVPMKYNDYVLGDIINVPINRETTEMLGMYKCEIIGKSYDLNNSLISFDLRIINQVFYLLTEDGEYLLTEDGYMIIV